MIQMLRKEACSGSIDDLANVRTEVCLGDVLTKASAKPEALITEVETGILTDVDMHQAFWALMQNKALLLEWRQFYVRPDAEYCLSLTCLCVEAAFPTVVNVIASSFKGKLRLHVSASSLADAVPQIIDTTPENRSCEPPSNHLITHTNLHHNFHNSVYTVDGPINHVLQCNER